MIFPQPMAYHWLAHTVAALLLLLVLVGALPSPTASIQQQAPCLRQGSHVNPRCESRACALQDLHCPVDATSISIVGTACASEQPAGSLALVWQNGSYYDSNCLEVAWRDVVSFDAAPLQPLPSPTLGSLFASHCPGNTTAACRASNAHFVHGQPAEAIGQQVLGAVAQDPALASLIASWDVTVYTDNNTFLFVDRWPRPTSGIRNLGPPKKLARQTAVFMSGVYLTSTTTSSSSFSSPPIAAPPPLPGAAANSTNSSSSMAPLEPPGVLGNFSLGVTNGTFHSTLLQLGSIETDAPLLLLLAGNVTWVPHPAMPAAGMDLRRPVLLVGAGGAAAGPVGLDLGMAVNQVRIHCPHGNLTMHNLYLENLGYGDRVTGKIGQGTSLVNPVGLWFLTVNRTEPRVSLKNVTLVLNTLGEYQFQQTWPVMFVSESNSQAVKTAWLRQINVVAWAAEPPPDPSVHMFNTVRFVRNGNLWANVRITHLPQLFPRRAMPHWDPDLYTVQLDPNKPPPYMATVGNASALMAGLELSASVDRDGILMLGSPYLDLRPGPAAAWLPAGGLSLQRGKSSLVGDSLQDLARLEQRLMAVWAHPAFGCTQQHHRNNTQQVHGPYVNGISTNSSGDSQQGQLAAAMAAAAAAPAVPGLPALTLMDFGGAAGLFQLPETADTDTLSFHKMALAGLGQQAGLGCKDLSDPGAWTLLLWAVDR